MAAFTHPNPQGSRFSDGSYGVFYCARKRDTAIAETRHHATLFMEATREPPMRLQMRLYTVEAKGEAADLRAASQERPPHRRPRRLQPHPGHRPQPAGRRRAGHRLPIGAPSRRRMPGCPAHRHRQELPARRLPGIPVERAGHRCGVRGESGVVRVGGVATQAGATHFS